jgi:hypothetical protein
MALLVICPAHRQFLPMPASVSGNQIDGGFFKGFSAAC